MSLSECRKRGWLAEHKTDALEIASLFAIVAREISDSQVKGISPDGMFTHAYRASLTPSTILLYASGYSVSRGHSHHHRTIACLPKILGDEIIHDAKYLDKCRELRNAAEYEGIHESSAIDGEGLVEFTKAFERQVRTWVKKNRAEFM
jgi:Xaa-Pro aminopeptidase